MKDLAVINGKICTADGKIFLIKGVSIPDPVNLYQKEGLHIEQVFDLITNKGFNCVRIPVLPGHFLIIDEYLEKHIDLIVTLCKNQGLYCILDWHAIGNPLTGETRLKEYYHEKNGKKVYWYESNIKLAEKGLLQIARRYGSEPHVLLELFNEPAPGDKNVPQLELSALKWCDWKKNLENIINKIRKHTNNILVISPTYWAYQLDLLSKAPINGENIAFSFHCYPIKRHENWKEMLETTKNLPIIVTEWGFDTDKIDSQYYGSAKEYAAPLMKYCKQHQIGWVAWCLSKSWRPRMVLTWNPTELTEFGKFVMKQIN